MSPGRPVPATASLAGTPGEGWVRRPELWEHSLPAGPGPPAGGGAPHPPPGGAPPEGTPPGREGAAAGVSGRRPGCGGGGGGGGVAPPPAGGPGPAGGGGGHTPATGGDATRGDAAGAGGGGGGGAATKGGPEEWGGGASRPRASNAPKASAAEGACRNGPPASKREKHRLHHCAPSGFKASHAGHRTGPPPRPLSLHRSARPRT